MILYEVYWNLIEKHGFTDNWYNSKDTGGNIIFAQLLIDGMKLQPCLPTFVDARDAIIEADRINNNGDNFDELWAGFAKRGLGVNAKSPGIEDFNVPKKSEGTSSTTEKDAAVSTSAAGITILLPLLAMRSLILMQ